MRKYLFIIALSYAAAAVAQPLPERAVRPGSAGQVFLTLPNGKPGWADQALATATQAGLMTPTQVNKLATLTAQVQADWNQTTTTATDFIKNKPTLFSGDYTDLTNRPTLFSGNYTDLTGKPTIPAAQIAADWTQTTTTALDYIKNKPDLAGHLVDAEFNTADDGLVLESVDGTKTTTTLRDVSLAPDVYYVSQTGFSATPQVGNLRRTYSSSALPSGTTNGQFVFLPGQFTLTRTLGDVREVSGMRGSHVTSGVANLLAPTGTGQFKYNFDRLENSNFLLEATSSDADVYLGIRQLLSTHGVFAGSIHRKTEICIGKWEVSGSQFGIYAQAPTDYVRINIDHLIDNRVSFHTNGPIVFTSSHSTTSGYVMSARIGLFESDRTKGLDWNPINIGQKQAATINSSNNTYQVTIDELRDNTTGGYANSNRDSEYVNIPSLTAQSRAIAIVHVGLPAISGAKGYVEIKRGRMRSPVIISHPYKGGGGTNTTYRVNLGQIDAYDEPLIIADTWPSTRGRAYFHSNAVRQWSDQAMIKIGSCNLDTFNISGHWQSDATTKAIIYTSEDLHLYNAELVLTSGTQNKIESNVPVNVYLYGSTYLTQDEVGSNVTLVYRGGKPSNTRYDMSEFAVSGAAKTISKPDAYYRYQSPSNGSTVDVVWTLDASAFSEGEVFTLDVDNISGSSELIVKTNSGVISGAGAPYNDTTERRFPTDGRFLFIRTAAGWTIVTA